ncbi:uncharacterized protein TNCV_2446991 [Trichonephila clavipes]|nr:uncharacterized protein TNCV_2446991 [Trichonephila clavipes]
MHAACISVDTTLVRPHPFHGALRLKQIWNEMSHDIIQNLYAPSQVMLRHYMKVRGLVMGQVDRTQENSKDLGKPRVSEHWDQKRPTPEPTQGIKRTIPSSVSSRKCKHRRPNDPSQGSQSIAGPSHQIDTRQGKPPTEGSRQEASGQYDKDNYKRKQQGS